MAGPAATSLISAAQMHGWLTKKGATFKTWKRRYFILSGSKAYYFKTATDATPLGCVDLSRASEVIRTTGPYTHMIHIVTPGRKWELSADRDADAESWATAFRDAKDVRMSVRQSVPVGGLQPINISAYAGVQPADAAGSPVSTTAGPQTPSSPAPVIIMDSVESQFRPLVESIDQTIIPSCVERIRNACGVAVPVAVDWQTFYVEKADRMRAANTLSLNNGANVFERIALAVEDVCRSSGEVARRSIGLLQRISLRYVKGTNSNSKKMDLENAYLQFDNVNNDPAGPNAFSDYVYNGVLVYTAAWEGGVNCCFTVQEIANTLFSYLKISEKIFYNQLVTTIVPNYRYRIGQATGRSIPIVFDWSGMNVATNKLAAIQTITEKNSANVLERIALAIEGFCKSPEGRKTVSLGLSMIVLRFVPSPADPKNRKLYVGGASLVTDAQLAQINQLQRLSSETPSTKPIAEENATAAKSNAAETVESNNATVESNAAESNVTTESNATESDNSATDINANESGPMGSTAEAPAVDKLAEFLQSLTVDPAPGRPALLNYMYNGVLEYFGAFDLGQRGCFTQQEIAAALDTSLGLKEKMYIEEMETSVIPEAVRKVASLLNGKQLHIGIDWATFAALGPNNTIALQNLCINRSANVIQRLVKTIEHYTQQGGIRTLLGLNSIRIQNGPTKRLIATCGQYVNHAEPGAQTVSRPTQVQLLEYFEAVDLLYEVPFGTASNAVYSEQEIKAAFDAYFGIEAKCRVDKLRDKILPETMADVSNAVGKLIVIDIDWSSLMAHIPPQFMLRTLNVLAAVPHTIPRIAKMYKQHLQRDPARTTVWWRVGKVVVRIDTKRTAELVHDSPEGPTVLLHIIARPNGDIDWYTEMELANIFQSLIG